MSTNQVYTPQPHYGRYFWADVDHFPEEGGDRFVGRFHVAVQKTPKKYSIQRADGHAIDLDYGTEVTRAYSREEAETAVRRADTKYQALQSDEQLELDL